MKARHVIIPIFVPHKGCPNDCIFCNQKKISGQIEEMTPQMIPGIIESHLATIDSGTFVEAAFYGGSFTAIDRSLQESLLKKAYEYVKSGRVSEIRLSTRPDCIDEDILEMLQKYGVRTIELGVQSLDDEVLKASCRGHDAACVYKSAALIKGKGFRLGIQTMTGLPGDTREKAMNTARQVISMSPEIVRIYPVLVIKGTPLEKLLLDDRYEPMPLDEAVKLCAELLDLYESHGINVIRIGLQATENIRGGADSDVVAGPVHPAFRQLVESELARRRIERIIEERGLSGSSSLLIKTGAPNISNVVGQKRANIDYLRSKYHIVRIKVMDDGSGTDDVEIEKVWNSIRTE